MEWKSISYQWITQVILTPIFLSLNKVKRDLEKENNPIK